MNHVLLAIAVVMLLMFGCGVRVGWIIRNRKADTGYRIGGRGSSHHWPHRRDSNGDAEVLRWSALHDVDWVSREAGLFHDEEAA